MDRTQQRFERFAQLRAAYPEHDYEDIMARIHDEEVEADEAAEGRRILTEAENQANSDYAEYAEMMREQGEEPLTPEQHREFSAAF